MALTSRKPRPIVRDGSTLRDDRLFVIACDDTYAPKQYFELFKLSRVQIHVVATEDGTSAAPHVLSRLKEIATENDDERWMILDVDHCTQPNHVGTYIAAISEARRSGISVALSNPSFELWLLLHHLDCNEVASLKKAADVETLLRQTLGGYNKTQINPDHFLLESVPAACERARRLGEEVGGGDRPDGNMTDIHLLVRSIISKALPSQVPESLRSLLTID